MRKDLRKNAVKLRLQGNTYSDINKKLKKNIPKSTLSEWFRVLHFNSEQKLLLKQRTTQKLRMSQLKALRVNKRQRIAYLKGLKEKNKYLLKFLNTDTKKLLLAILYLGEGAKTRSTQFLSLGSSNPQIIRFYLLLLKECFEINNSKFRIRIQCRADQDIKKLETYWQRITKIPKKQFYPTYIDKRTINKPTLHKDYKGVCAVHYFDRSIQFELEFLAGSVLKYVIEGR